MIADYETNVVYFSSWLEKEYPKIYIDLVTVLKKNNVAYDIIPCTNDIWCRDYMPVQIDEDRFLCYRYYPDYLLKRKSDKRFITDSQEVCMRLGLKTTNTNIIMDGGNIVKVGDKVKKGDLLCYIEAMKTYNAIRADFDGTVTAICATSGDPVAEDDVLMKIG